MEKRGFRAHQAPQPPRGVVFHLARGCGPFDRLVDLPKLRWRIEREYQELKPRPPGGRPWSERRSADLMKPPSGHYVALAREASTSGDRVAAENLYQHAEH